MLEYLQKLEHLEVSVVIVLATMVTLTEIALKYKPLVKWLSGKTGYNESECYIYISRFSTFLMWGVLPALFMLIVFKRSPVEFGLGLPQGRWWWWLAGGILGNTIMLTLRYFTPKVNMYYPEMTVAKWPPQRFFRYGFSWVIGLLGYEFLYRGLLFTACLNAFGLLPAVVITSCMYGLAHIDRTMEEAFNSTYFHAALCIMVYFQHSIWIVYSIHLFIAVLNSFFQIKKRPDMEFVPAGR